MPVSYQSAPLPSHLSLPNGLMNTVAAAAVKEIMNGLSKSDRGEPGGLHGGGGFIWAFRALMVFSTLTWHFLGACMPLGQGEESILH